MTTVVVAVAVLFVVWLALRMVRFAARMMLFLTVVGLMAAAYFFYLR